MAYFGYWRSNLGVCLFNSFTPHESTFVCHWPLLYRSRGIGCGDILDGELLARYPEGYRHLAYSLVRSGNKVQTNMPGLDGPELEAVYAHGAAWLDGRPLQMPT